MSPELQRITIAGFCGWTCIEDFSSKLMMPLGTVLRGYPETNAIIGKKVDLPDYLNDLNAMRAAIEHLRGDDHREMEFQFCLSEVCGFPDGRHHDFVLGESFELIQATAAQRAEAFVRAIGKWKE